jgi:putative Holliday junction resolvase
VKDPILELALVQAAPRVRAWRIAEAPGGVKARPHTADILAGVRVLGVDLGEARIGVALSDETGTLATGLPTLRSAGPRRDAQAVAALVREHGAGEVVIGMPYRLDGTVGPQGEKAQAFAERLRRALRVPVVLRDERLTSVAADERLALAGVKRRDRREKLDRVAAEILLQEHLDERRARAAAGSSPAEPAP